MSSSLVTRQATDDAASTAVVKPALSQAVGYVVVVLIGLIIAFGMPSISLEQDRLKVRADMGAVMIFVTRVLKKTVGEDNAKTEMYAFRPSCSSEAPIRGLAIGMDEADLRT